MVRSKDNDSKARVTADGDGLFDAELKLPLTTAAKLSFASQKTRPPSRATLIRWIRKGKCGVRLESRRFNGNYQTSVEAIMRFVRAVDCATDNPMSKESRRSNELERVSQVLDDLGI